ncbi:MAG: ABC transporter ATP-binding protein [Caldilinea sp.]|uniref:ABC transporter ATP-binding protein n=1 Tax=Caldilinea sp. TaxID=2293560 RepID=UPI002CB23E1D|nr:ABC transporter ATP-binding protein [Anaerolineales bacterium]HQY90104.1 ABC transporter ATP-binding protein [Caldilinea sp.]HRA68301.1 ABC transporter ATP-binding protein [Caldilinea sp.]
MSEHFLEIRDVSKIYRIGGLIGGSKIAAVDHVSLTLEAGKPQILSVVGESGSGKTTLARMIARLIQPTEGEIFIDGKSTSGALNHTQMREFRRKVQPIFQNPFESFSSRKTVDTYLFETARNIAGARGKTQAHQAVEQALASVGLAADRVIGRYPNQFSGGELQRVSVARAMIPRPELLVADEPVSMIDASLRMNVVNLFKDLRDQYNVTILYITHDLSTAYYVSDLIAIMYRGKIVEYGPSSRVLKQPAHPYTELLLDSVAKIGEKWSEVMSLPDMETKEYGYSACKFAGRCPYVRDICRQVKPPLVDVGGGQEALCFKLVDYQNVEQQSTEKVQTHAI